MSSAFQIVFHGCFHAGHAEIKPITTTRLLSFALYQGINISVIDVNMLVLHNLAPFTRQVAYFIRKNAQQDRFRMGRQVFVCVG